MTLPVKRTKFDSAGTLPMSGFSPLQKPLLQTSYQFANQIAKSKKLYPVGEVLIKPCILKMANVVLGKEAAKKLKQLYPMILFTTELST